MLLASKIQLVLFFCQFCRLERRKIFYMVKFKHIIVLYLQIFNAQNLNLVVILKIFLKFGKFQPRYAYKIHSHKKERV